MTVGGDAYCWSRFSGGLGGSERARTPVLVPGGLSFATVSVGAGYACGVTVAGSAYCWGDNRVGQLGQPAAGEFSAIPVKVAGQP